MVKFVGVKDGKPLYGFGLSEANCAKLVAGHPIIIDLDVMETKPDPNGMRGAVIIFGGKTEASMQSQLEHKIGPDTRVNIDPALRDPNTKGEDHGNF